MKYILQHAETLTQTLGYYQTDCQDDDSKLSKVSCKIKDRYSHICQLHIYREYQQIPKRRNQAVPRRQTNIAPDRDLIVYMIYDRGYVRRPVMSPRAQVLGIFLKKGPMSLHLRHIYRQYTEHNTQKSVKVQFNLYQIFIKFVKKYGHKVRQSFHQYHSATIYFNIHFVPGQKFRQSNYL